MLRRIADYLNEHVKVICCTLIFVLIISSLLLSCSSCNNRCSFLERRVIGREFCTDSTPKVLWFQGDGVLLFPKIGDVILNMWKGKLLCSDFFQKSIKLILMIAWTESVGKAGFVGVSDLSFFAFSPLRECWDTYFLSQRSSMITFIMAFMSVVFWPPFP